MFYTENFRINLSMLNKSNYISNKGLLSILQDIAEMHSSSVGYGVTDIKQTNYSWALLNWKVKIISRPKYGEIVTLKTWSRYSTKLYSYRDFEVLNSKGDVIVIATSKWILLNATTGKIAKIGNDIIDKYSPEDKSVFSILELPKLKELEYYSYNKFYPIRKSDIDINNHMNNLCYLDIATELLPENITGINECNEFEIMYKKQIQLNDNIIAFYGKNSVNTHYIVVKDNNDTIHSIMKFK